jgi:hypothetical protein
MMLSIMGNPILTAEQKRFLLAFQRFTAIQGLLFNRWDGLISRPPGREIFLPFWL